MEGGLGFGRDAVGKIPQQRSPPEVAELIGDEFTDIDRLRFQFERRQCFRRDHVPDVGEYGAKTKAGADARQALVRHNTGRAVSSSGGSFSGAKVSRRLPASDRQSGCVRLGGGSKSSGISGSVVVDCGRYTRLRRHLSGKT